MSIRTKIIPRIPADTLLLNTNEGQTVSIQLFMEEIAELRGYETQTAIHNLGDAAGRVVDFQIDGVSSPFQCDIAEGAIKWEIPLPKDSELRLVFHPSLTFSVLNGALPPGLRLNPEVGSISGLVGNVMMDHEYRFTIRARGQTSLIDVPYRIQVAPLRFPAQFNRETLEPLSYDSQLGRYVKRLPSMKRGEPFAYTIDVSDPDGEEPTLIVKKVTGLPAFSNRYGGLPPGMELVGRTIRGIVDAESCAGEYLCEIVIQDNDEPSSLVFVFSVEDKVGGPVGALPSVEWLTPPGDIGTIIETEPCYLSVRAISHNAGPVTYSLAPNSGALPFGMSLDPETGDLHGKAPHVLMDSTYTFTVRASAGLVFEDRTFTMTVRNVFVTPTVQSLHLRLRVLEGQELIAPYEFLDDEILFRANDPSFGLVKKPFVYLINGLDPQGDMEKALRGDPLMPGFVSKDYHAPFRLILGPHRFYSAYASSGEHIYDVLVRELYDPQHRGGGFRFGTDVVISEKVSNPISPIYHVFPSSVRNIRRDLVADIGLASSDENKRFVVGVHGGELLPLWMRSEQVPGDPSSVPGFTLALVIAYLKPGYQRVVRNLLEQNADEFLEGGKVYYFDRYFSEGRQLKSKTGFMDNEGETLFEPGTIFDAKYSEIVKYL